MSADNGKNGNNKKLLQGSTRFSFGVTAEKKPRNKNRRIKYLSEPHLELRKINGKNYYYYRHGISSQIYLGTPDFILSACQEKRGQHD